MECQQSNRHWLPNRFVFYKVNYLSFLNCQDIDLLHFVAFFHVAMFSTGVDNGKVGVNNEKALELKKEYFFHISA